MAQRHMPFISVLTGLLITAGLPLALLIDTSLAYADGWRTTSRLDFCLVMVMIGLVSVTFVLFQVASLQHWFAENRREHMMLLLSICVCWLLVEIVLEYSIQPRSPEASLLHRRWPHLTRIFTPDPAIMPGIEGRSEFTTNSMGIRGTELPPAKQAYRILCVGGSTTECLYLDNNETWSAQLENMLNNSFENRKFWVGNTGIAGYSTTQHLSFVQRSEIITRFDCLLFMIGINDLTAFLMSRDRTLLVQPNRAPDFRIPFWKHSRILNLLRTQWHLWKHSYDVEDPGGANYQLRRHIRRTSPRTNRLPEHFDIALRNYRTSIHQIVTTCMNKGVTPLFATQPVLWSSEMSEASKDLLWMGALEEGRFLTETRLREAIELYNRTLREYCQQHQIGCIDLASMDGRETFFYDDCHFNEAGSQMVSRIMTDWFNTQSYPYILFED